MAISRYDRYSRFTPQDNYYQLDFDTLAKPILKADQEYQLYDAKVGETIQSFDQDVLPQDMADLQAKQQALMAEEKALRDEVKGDILDPRYREQMQSRFLSEAADPWYKQTAYMKTQFDAYQKAVTEYKAKTGQDPSDWQDPFGGFMKGFESTSKSGVTAFTGITPQMPFYPKAVDYLEPAITKKLVDEEFTTERGPDGTVVMLNSANQKVTKADLLKILEGNSELMTGNEIQQMRLDYAEKISKGMIDPGVYPTFEDYLYSTVESIVTNLAYSWHEEKGSLINTAKAEARPRTSRARGKSSDEEWTGMTGPAADTPRGAAPIWAPSSEAARVLSAEAERTKEELRTTRINNLSNSIAQRIGHNDFSVGLEEVQNSDPNKYTEASVTFSFTNEDGNEETISLPSPDGLLRAQELGMTLEEIGEAYKIQAEFMEQEATVRQDRDFRRASLDKAFDLGDRDSIKERGFYSGYLSAKQRQEVYENSGVDVIDKLTSGTVDNSYEDEFYTNPVTGTTTRKSSLGADSKNIEKLFGFMGGQLHENAVGSEAYQAMETFVREEMGKLSNQEIMDLKQRYLENESEQYLLEEKDPQYIAYAKYFTDRWEKGLDANFNALPGEGNRAGIRTVPKRVFHLNLTNTPDGERWVKNFNELIMSNINRGVSGDGDQMTTYSNLSIFREGDDKALNSEEIQERFVNAPGDPQKWKLLGVFLDDTGFSIELSAPDKDGVSDNYEIRGGEAILDYLEQSGVQNKYVLKKAQDMLMSFQDTDRSLTRDPGNTRAGSIHTYGQTRSEVSTTVELGAFSRPVYRSPVNGDFMGVPNVKEGQFLYYSLTDKDWKIHDDPIKATLEVYRDRAFMFERIEGIRSFDENSFSGVVGMDPALKTGGTNYLSKRSFQAVNYLVEQPNSDIFITSAHRDKNHRLTEANPHSAHQWFDAVDMRVLDMKTGKISPSKVQFFYDNMEALNNMGYTMQLEFSSADEKEYDYYKSLYPEFVSVVGHADGTHVHIEYNRAGNITAPENNQY